MLEVTVRIQHNFIAWHQRQHLIDTNGFKCDTCSISKDNNVQKIVLPNRVVNINVVHPTLLSNLTILSHRFVNMVKLKKGLSRSDVSSIAISLLSFFNSKNTVSDIDRLLALSTCLFSCYDETKKFNAEFADCTCSREDKIRTMRRFFSTDFVLNSNISNAVYKMLLTEKFLPDMCISLVILKIYNRNDLLENLFDDCARDSSFELSLSEHMLSLICLTSHKCNAVFSIDNDYQYSVFCNSCSPNSMKDDHLKDATPGILQPIEFAENSKLSDLYVEHILRLVQSNQLPVRLNIVKCLPAICLHHSHLLCATKNLFWTNIFNDKELACKFEFLQIIPRIIDGINVSWTT